MQATTGPGVLRVVRRVLRACQEMDYAQKRLFEIRTVIAVLKPAERPQLSSSIDQLEALYALTADEARDRDV